MMPGVMLVVCSLVHTRVWLRELLADGGQTTLRPQSLHPIAREIGPRCRSLEQIDKAGGSPDQPHEWKTHGNEHEWNGENQKNRQRNVGEHRKRPVTARGLRPRDVDDGEYRQRTS